MSTRPGDSEADLGEPVEREGHETLLPSVTRSVLSAKSFWHGPLTPVIMVASAFLAGTALLGIVFFAVWRFGLQDRERAVSMGIPSIRLLLAVGLGLVGSLLAVKLGMGLSGGEPGLRDATIALVTGPLAVQFWVIRVLLGLVIPLAIVTMPMTRTPSWLFVAAIGALGGVLVDRYLFVMAGQIAPITADSVMTSPKTRLCGQPRTRRTAIWRRRSDMEL